MDDLETKKVPGVAECSPPPLITTDDAKVEEAGIKNIKTTLFVPRHYLITALSIYSNI